MEINWDELPGVKRIRYPRVNDFLRLTMEFENGEGLYIDVSPNSSQSQMEETLDALYKIGLKRGYIQINTNNFLAPKTGITDIEAWFNRQPDWLRFAIGLGTVAVGIWLSSTYGQWVGQHVEEDINILKNLPARDQEAQIRGMYGGFYRDPVHDTALRIALFLYGLNDSNYRTLYGYANYYSEQNR